MINVFNSNYEEVGDLKKNLVLNTLGKVKIRYGKKFIDILDNQGNLNVNVPKILHKIDSLDEIKKNGIYLINDSVYLNIDGNIIQLSGESEIYIKYLGKQNLTQEQINTAQNNIGLKFDSLGDAINLNNQIVFVGNQIYYINQGIAKLLTLNSFLDSINQSQLTAPLEDCYLVYKDGSWQLDELIQTNDENFELKLNEPLSSINNANLGIPPDNEFTEDGDELPVALVHYNSGWKYEPVVPYSLLLKILEEYGNKNYKVSWYVQNQLYTTTNVQKDTIAQLPESPEIDDDNLIFDRWDYNNTPIVQDTTINAILAEATTYRWFNGLDDRTLYYTEKVKSGVNPSTPEDPIRQGYYFDGWLNLVDTEAYAKWVKVYLQTNLTMLSGNGEDFLVITYRVYHVTDNGVGQYEQIYDVPENTILNISISDYTVVSEGYNDGWKQIVIQVNRNSSNEERTFSLTAEYDGYQSNEIIITQLPADQLALPPFDYLVFNYTWTNEDGTDLDSATVVRNSNISIGGGKNLNDIYCGYSGINNTGYLEYGGDNQQSGLEGSLINFKKLIEDISDISIKKLYIDIYANWYIKKQNGSMNFNYKTYNGDSGLTLNSQTHEFIPNEGTELVSQDSVEGLNVYAYGKVNHYDVKTHYTRLLTFEYDIENRQAILKQNYNKGYNPTFTLYYNNTSTSAEVAPNIKEYYNNDAVSYSVNLIKLTETDEDSRFIGEASVPTKVSTRSDATISREDTTSGTNLTINVPQNTSGASKESDIWVNYTINNIKFSVLITIVQNGNT